MEAKLRNYYFLSVHHTSLADLPIVRRSLVPNTKLYCMYDGKAVRGPGNEASLCDKAVDLQNSRRARGTEHVMEDPRAKCSRRGPMFGGGGPMSRGAQCLGGSNILGDPKIWHLLLL